MAYSSIHICLPFFSATSFTVDRFFYLWEKHLTFSLLLIQISFSRRSSSHLRAGPTTLAFFFNLLEILHPFLITKKWWRATFVWKTMTYSPLLSINWDTILFCDSVDDAISFFNDVVFTLFDICFPFDISTYAGGWPTVDDNIWSYGSSFLN